MAHNIREYSGLLCVHLDPQSQEQVRAVATRHGLELDVADDYIEFDYQGRDTNRFVVAFLVDLARDVVDAEGEVRCESVSEETDPSFEFFSIRGGKLIRQRAVLIREVGEVID